DDLERWQHREPIQARPSSALERVQKWVRRRPAIAALSAALAAALLIGLVLVVWEWRATLFAQKQTEAARDVLRQNLYVSQTGVAFASMERGNVTRARQLLESLRPNPKQPEDLRGFEWRYLWGISRAQELFTASPGGPVWSVRFSPDGQFLAAGMYGEI